MFTESRRVFVLAALIVATGVTTVETTRGIAQADPKRVSGGAAGYAGDRIEGAFSLVSATPAALKIAVATKADFPGAICTESLRAGASAGCMTVAYGAAQNSATVVEVKRGTSSSILTRLSRISVAGF